MSVFVALVIVCIQSLGWDLSKYGLDVFRTSRFLLSHNNSSAGVGRPWHLADLYILCWGNDRGVNNSGVYQAGTPSMKINFMSEKLREKGLVRIDGGKIYAERSTRNEHIFEVTKAILSQ